MFGEKKRHTDLMWKTRFTATLLASTIVLAACGDGGGDDTSATDTGTPPDKGPASVIVYRPGVIDVDPDSVDAPDWPGPEPSEFLELDPTSGEKGELTGEDAATVYRAVLDHPDALLADGQDPGDLDGALWRVDQDIQLLVVEPVW